MARTGRFLLDTNLVIAFSAREVAIRQRSAEASGVLCPVLSLADSVMGRGSPRV